jgi:uncharacterized membrane protein HdeD (DUF308 family)
VVLSERSDAMATYPVDEISADTRDTVEGLTGFWWLWLVTGVLWIIVALAVLQFDKASISTVGVIIGLMFLFAGTQQFAAAALSDGAARWLAIGFGALLVVAGIVALFNPKNTFAGMADILGFLFLCVAATWIVEALVTRDENDLWWLGLISGILMAIMAFWTSGQFFIQKAYILLVFAGIWALMKGVTDIVRAFQVRRLHRELG